MNEIEKELSTQALLICPKCGDLFGSEIPFNPDNEEVCPQCSYKHSIDTGMNSLDVNNMLMKNHKKWLETKNTMRKKYTINSDVFDQDLYNKIIKEEYEREHLNDDVVTTPAKPVVKNIPKCPTCGSTNIEKISATKKLAGSMLFGLFSKDAKSTFHCKNCNYKW